MSARIILCFLKDEGGATAIEYALLGTLVAVAIVGSFAVVGNSLLELFNNQTAGVLNNQAQIANGG